MAVSATKLAGGGASTAAVTPTFTAQAAGVWLVLQVSSDDYRLTTGSNRPENTGWTLRSSGEDFLGSYVWTKISTGSETSVIYGIGSAVSSAWQIIAVSGATGTLYNTPAATHTHGGGATASGSATPPSGNAYALACFGSMHSNTNSASATYTNSFASVGFQTGPASGSRENVSAAGLATTTSTAVSSAASWNAAILCAYGSVLIFVEASGGATNFNVTASATGVGAVEATAVVEKQPTAAVTGVGAVSATAVVARGATADVTGTAGVTATAVVQENASAAVTGVGAVNATAVVVAGASIAVDVTGVGAVSATAVVTVNAAIVVGVNGVGAVAADAVVQKNPTALVTAVAAVAATAQVQAALGASVGGTASVSATALVTTAGSVLVAVTGVGAVAATAVVGLYITAAINGLAGIMATMGGGTPPDDTGDFMTNQDLERQYLLGISTDPGENFDSTPDLRDIIYGDRQSSGVASAGVSAADAEIASLRAASVNPLKNQMSLADLRRERWGG